MLKPTSNGKNMPRQIEIVLVEDDEPMLSWMYNEFHRAFRGVRIDTHQTEASFRKAIPRLVEHPPALIVMDVMLRWSDTPEQDPLPRNLDGYRAGFRCRELLSKYRSTRGVPMIFYTAVPAPAVE